MAITRNAGSVFLAAANPRLLTSANAAILLSTSKALFHVNSVGVPDASAIVITAQLILLDGVVTFSCTGGALTSVANNSATLLYSNMTADVATITASLVYRGITFTQSTKITRVLDSSVSGSNGLSNAIAYAYQRSATAPTASPGDITYDFGLGGISFPSTLANGWLKVIPSGNLPLYVTAASASNSAATDSIASNEWSTPVVLAQNGLQGTSVATVYIYQRTSSNSAPSLPGASTTFTFSSATLAGLTNGWSSTVPSSSAGGYLWVSTATAVSDTGADTILSSEWAAAQLLSQDGTGVGSPGAPGNSVATVTLYQWSTVVPANPTGTATFTWASGATTAYSATDGWYISAPANPGGLIKLFIASVPVTAPAGTASSTVTFGSATIVALSQNGAAGAQGVPGLKTANVSAYQWGLSAPTTTGTATYTWLAGTYDTPPSTGWTTTKGNAPGSGYTLYEASVRLVESTGANTSVIDWTQASVAGIAYQGASGGAGSQGASARRAYTLVDGNTLALSPTTVTVAGGSTYPTTGTWGETRAWQATPPNPAAGQTVFQADGIFDPVPNQTVWNVPYLSQLKVGSLSAYSSNLGQITAGSIDLGSGALSWHVDSSGNMWSGASTYAAAKFRVSTGGDVVMKSFILQDGSGNTILSAGGLAAGFEAPGTKNADIIIGGRNLYPDSAFERDQHPCTNKTASLFTCNPKYSGALQGNQCLLLESNGGDSYVLLGGPVAQITPGTTYTISYWYFTGGAITGGSSYFYSNGTPYALNQAGAATGAWVRSVTTWTAPAGCTTIEMRFGFNCNAYASMGVDMIQIEVGNKVTDWRPSVEDVAADTALAQAKADTAFNNSQTNATNIQNKLTKNGSDILSGQISLQSQYAINVGTINDGLYMGSTGLVGRKAGVTTFVLDNAGNATFGGQLQAAYGTLGSLTVSSGGHIKSGAYSSYAWPPAGAGGGFFLSAGGILFGSVYDGKYFQIESGGNVYAPGFSIINGVLTLTGATVNSPVINTPIIPPITGGSLSQINASGGGSTIQMGSRTAVGAGGTAPYRYNWRLDGDDAISIVGSDSTATVTLRATGSTGSQPGTTAICQITDASGLTGYTSFDAYANFI